MSAVSRAAALLDLYFDEKELGVREIARRLDMSKSSAHRLIHDLAESGLLFKDPGSGRYRLGIRLLEYGLLVQDRHELHIAGRAVLRGLARATGTTAHLGILDGTRVAYVDRAEGESTVRPGLYIGRRLPTYCTSLGKAILAFQAPALLEAVIQAGLLPYTRHTITDPSELRLELNRVRRRGYALNLEEFEAGLNGIGAPVRLPDSNEVIAAISVNAPVHRLPRQRLPELADMVTAAARQISEELG